MDEINDENPKTSNQAWRKRPRKFFPKSRLGCKTCKIRRVKCDLSRPSCLKCKSTGRTCDGYGEITTASKPENTLNHYHDENVTRVETCPSYYSSTTTMAYQVEKRHAKYRGTISRNPGPFMVLPVTGPVQTEAMSFFEYISIRHLNEYHPCELWRKTLMFFSQTVPSVRHAAVALSLTYRNYIDCHQPQSSKDRLRDKAPLFHYNQAIQLLLDQHVGDSPEITAITLLVCYLLTCFDQLAGNYMQAINHLRGGVEISRKMNKGLLNSDNTYEAAKSPEVHTLISQVTRQISRLDMQTATSLIDWTPADIQDISTTQSLSSGGGFRSLDQAADHLQTIIARAMGVGHTENEMPLMSETLPIPSSLKDSVLGQMESWLSLFEALLKRGGSYEKGPAANSLISLLTLQHTIAWIFLSTSGPGREMDYDDFLQQFRHCVSLAGDVATAHERYSGSPRPTFTPEIGILPVLYLIGAKCRHPTVRREALSILRRQLIREAAWDSICVARVVERVIEIEETGCEEGEQIPVWQRIESLSWVLVVNGQSVDKVDITYSFCMQEGFHIESLLV